MIRIIKILGFIIVLAGAGYFALEAKELGSINALFDRTPPEIAMEPGFKGIGRSNALSLHLSDTGSGIKEIEVSLIQDQQRLEILKEQVSEGDFRISRDISFNPFLKQLRPGAASIEIITSDASIWGNASKKSIVTIVDLSPPKLELLTMQHSINQGGCELVIFRAEDENLAGQGVRIADLDFPAVPASDFDTKLSGPAAANMFAGLIALPYDFDSSKTSAELYAIDQVGNETRAALSFITAKHNFRHDKLNLNMSFLDSAVRKLLAASLEPEDQAINQLPGSSPEERAQIFSQVNKIMRQRYEIVLRDLMTKPPTPRKWLGIFDKPLLGKWSSNFGEARTYFIDGNQVGESVHHGVDLASVENDKVHAAAKGIVIAAQDMGLYGNTVILDHGMGLFSLYGHLSSILVNEGDQVDSSRVLGHTGKTGFVAGDHLHFEVRVRGIPVSPIEWWDPKWYKDNIELKLSQALERITSSSLNPISN